MKFKQVLTTAFLLLSLFISGNAVNKEIKHNSMTIEELLNMYRVGSPSLSPNGKSVLFTVGVPNIKENKIHSYIFKIDNDGQNKVRLGDVDQNKYHPTWINQGKRIAYMSSVNGVMQLFSMNSDGSDVKQLSNVDGGISDYIFSPDYKRVAYIHDVLYNNNQGKNMYKDIPKTTGYVFTDLMYRHWDEFVESIPHIFLSEVIDGKLSEGKDILEGEPYEAPMKPFNGIEDVAFSPDGTMIAYASRKKTGKQYALSTNSDIYLYDTKTGKTTNISEGIMGYDTFPKFSPSGDYIAWISMEHDGFESDLKRMCIMDLKTRKRVFVTDDFEYDINALQWTEDSGSIYFTSCVEAKTHIFNISFHKTTTGIDLMKSSIKQITTGQYNYLGFDITNGIMIAARQSMKVPTDLYNINLTTGQATQITFENKELLNKLPSITVQERWVKTTDGGKMLVWVILPPNFDKKKKYPAILYCQGGPQSPVSQFFSFRWNFRLMAENGYVVVAPNRHGLQSFGKAWNEQISGDYPGQNMADYLSAIDDVSKEPWVDKDHLGCVGASYGAFSVYYLAGNSGDRFKALVAHNGIFNMEMQYMTTEEMWFANWDMGGAPWEKDNKVAQRTFANSPDKFINNWKTPILVIHSAYDYRIDPSQGFAAFNAAQLKGIPSEMLYFPDENHWVLKLQNSLLWHRTFYNWLDRWLKPHKSK